jgi:hypothetical protein
VRSDHGDGELVLDRMGHIDDLVEGDLVEQANRSVGIDVLSVDDPLLGGVARAPAA